MNSRNLFAPILMACLLTVGFGGLAPVANVASAGQSLMDDRESAKDAIGLERRGHDKRIHLPIGPGSVYYEYSLHDSRGYYPSHIGGYVYYNSKFDTPDYDDASYSDVVHTAKERCDRRFRSFEWDTGLYTTYRGSKKLCPYLR